MWILFCLCVCVCVSQLKIFALFCVRIAVVSSTVGYHSQAIIAHNVSHLALFSPSETVFFFSLILSIHYSLPAPHVFRHIQNAINVRWYAIMITEFRLVYHFVEFVALVSISFLLRSISITHNCVVSVVYLTNRT